MLYNSKLVPSKSEGRRMILQNGISLNGVKEIDVNKIIGFDDFKDECLVIQKGKKQFVKVVINNKK